jgi:hypothetical protein
MNKTTTIYKKGRKIRKFQNNNNNNNDNDRSRE